MLLSDRDILKCVTDHGLIENFSISNLQAASYDVSITGTIQRFARGYRRISLADPNSQAGMFEAVDIIDGYALSPGEMVIVTLRERLKMPSDLAAHIRPRTSFIRTGLLSTDHHVNPSYEGHLSLGVQNASPYSVELLPGVRIAQIVFERLSSEPSKERLYPNKPGAKYHGEVAFAPSKISAEVQKELEGYLKKLKEG